MGSVNEPRNVIGLSHLMVDENPEIDITELEKNIINGAKDLQAEEIDLAAQYKTEMQNLTQKFGISLTDDNVSNSIDAEKNINPIFKENNEYESVINESYNAAPDNKIFDEYYKPSRTPSFSNYGQNNTSGFADYSRDNENDLTDYKFSSTHFDQNDKHFSDFRQNNDYKDKYLNNMTQEQEKRSHLKQVFNNISNRDKIHMENYDLMGDREYEDKQMLLAEIDELREDLMQISVDISRVEEVDNNSSIEDIRKVHRKLVYKTNSNSYSSFADELFIIAAQAAEYAFDGEKDWFGHKPDLTGWTNTVRGKLRRMKYAKTRIVRRIIDEYKIPEWLQIGIEIVPTAFTHSRHRKSAVKDSVVNNSVYQDAIHNLNNLMD